MGHHWKRAAATAALALATVLSTAAAAPAANTVSYVTRPDLTPPKLSVVQSSKGQAPGFIFVAAFLNKFIQAPIVGQGGPMIVDNRGRVVWSRPVPATTDTLNLQLQKLSGKPVLTWYEGQVSGKTG